MSHNNYIYKRNHWQLHLKKVIQKERYPWLSYQSLCRKKKPGVLLFWTSRCGLVVRQNPPRNTEACSSKMAWPVLHGVTGPITPSRLCVPLRLGRFAGCFGGSCVSLFFFFWEKQLRSRTCDSNVSSGSLRVWCVLQLQSTIMCVCEVLPWIFFGVARKLGASHPIQTAATKNLTHSLFMTSHPNFPHMSPFTQKETNILKV